MLEGDALKGISFNLRNNANGVCEADDEQDPLVVENSPGWNFGIFVWGGVLTTG